MPIKKTCLVCQRPFQSYPSMQPKHRFCSRRCKETDQTGREMTKRPPLERLWEKIDRRGERDCWPWNGQRDTDGYGIFSYRQIAWKAHRAAYELIKRRKIPVGKIVRHSCDNPPCCNPEHLLVGTYADNNKDKCDRGRQRHLSGDSCPWKKVTSEDVKIIRASKEGLTRLAARFGISKSHAWSIRTRKCWK